MQGEVGKDGEVGIKPYHHTDLHPNAKSCTKSNGIQISFKETKTLRLYLAPVSSLRRFIPSSWILHSTPSWHSLWVVLITYSFMEHLEYSCQHPLPFKSRTRKDITLRQQTLFNSHLYSPPPRLAKLPKRFRAGSRRTALSQSKRRWERKEELKINFRCKILNLTGKKRWGKREEELSLRKRGSINYWGLVTLRSLRHLLKPMAFGL